MRKKRNYNREEYDMEKSLFLGLILLTSLDVNFIPPIFPVPYWAFSVCAWSCLTFCDPMECSLPGSSVHGIFQARTLEWVAISFSRESSRPSNWTQVSCIAGRFFTNLAMREALIHVVYLLKKLFIFKLYPFYFLSWPNTWYRLYFEENNTN